MSMHLPKHYEREIDKLKKCLLTLSAHVEENLHQSVKALINRDSELAKKIMDADHLTNEMEIEVEEECLKILALYHPVAADLRFIVSVLKINTDLERIGDLTVNIAERAQYLSTQPEIPMPMDFGDMADKTKIMLKESLDALIHGNTSLAHEVCTKDDQVDRMNAHMYTLVKEAIQKDPAPIEILLQYLSASRHLERIADHATNIAEDVVYMITGDIVRHQGETFQGNVHD